jgi:hypothetical protein
MNADSPTNGVPGGVRILPASAIIWARDRLPKIVKRPSLSRKVGEKSEREAEN